jgi:flagellar basal-body rod protein FlgB
VHADALALRADRTRMLAANIANENTPGFQARTWISAAPCCNVQAAKPACGDR